MKGYIYCLHAKTENDVFYIGSTINPKERLKSHITNYPYYIFDCRIGLSIIDEVDIEKRSDLNKLESYWIQQFVVWGFNLVNYNLHYGVDTRLLKAILCNET